MLDVKAFRQFFLQVMRFQDSFLGSISPTVLAAKLSSFCINFEHFYGNSILQNCVLGQKL